MAMRKFLIILTLFIAIGAVGGAVMMWGFNLISNIYFVFGLIEAVAAVICMRSK